jgi:hypothetical protein
MFELDDKKLRLINSFFSLTNVLPLDVLEFQNFLIFLLEDNSWDKIRKNMLFIKAFEKKLGKKIILKQFSKYEDKLILNVFKPYFGQLINKEDKDGKLFLQIGMKREEKEEFLKKPWNLKIVKLILSHIYKKQVKIQIKELKNGRKK